ncbi:YbjQ family protein [Haliovirga abyssi]|uniref:Metal-binding protein n=1 Tax=Haliovirga abyssi TaxID=2996794 RepID=A0AAU9DL33_9FUSO|nr:heavy metal-binding domain-containing protein [Haliovirga abyssi]BDU51614.1 metal-binding protein [Haliovirga abyssi]
MTNLLIFLGLLILGYFAGKSAEKNHYNRIKEKEKNLLNLPVVTVKKVLKEDKILKSELVTGSVVISIDYFKRIVAILINLFGGEVTSYESLIDRGRREAIIRMKEQAKGANIIINMRIQTSTISKSANNKNSVGSVEVLAYGTALWVSK